jgi:hypothetical protein
MTTLAIISVSGHAELLDLYPGQQKPKPCYVQLDLATGRMSAEIDPEIGNAVPMGVWHGLVRRYHLPGPPVAAVANAVMADMADHAQAVLDHAEVIWDGSNNVVRTHHRTCEYAPWSGMAPANTWQCDCPIAVAERAIEAVADGIHEDECVDWYAADDWYADSVDGVHEYVARVRAGEDLYEVVADMEQEIDESTVVIDIDRYLERAVEHALQDEEEVAR